MSAVTSFNPISNLSARVLVLGSMPGVLSLKANQYYAHPRNAFWPIMASVYGFDAESPYENRVEKLKASGVALWDVLHSCIRPGSLDSAIEAGSRVPNDFLSFFQQHPQIKRVIFNGAEAEKSFNTYVLPHLKVSGITFTRLPSSSPAHAVSLEQKISAWRAVLQLA
ncbi:MAG: DNA-deoxyinosine glycosylase [Pseudomonadota bacterium]